MKVKRDQWLDVIRDVIRDSNMPAYKDPHGVAMAIAESFALELNSQNQAGDVTLPLAAEIVAFCSDLVAGLYDQAIDNLLLGNPAE